MNLAVIFQYYSPMPGFEHITGQVWYGMQKYISYLNNFYLNTKITSKNSLNNDLYGYEEQTDDTSTCTPQFAVGIEVRHSTYLNPIKNT